MADLNFKTILTLTITEKEYKLITRALCNTLFKESDIDDAIDLSYDLTKRFEHFCKGRFDIANGATVKAQAVLDSARGV